MEFLKTVIHDPWVCGTAWVREWVRRGARSTGRDNDPDGLGYMPDSQGPQYGSKPTLTGAGVSGPRISPSDVFSPWHKSRERNYQCPLGALIIPLPHVFPPTYVGFGISYILGNLIKAKIMDIIVRFWVTIFQTKTKCWIGFRPARVRQRNVKVFPGSRQDYNGINTCHTLLPPIGRWSKQSP